jgi:hypothetical protein
MDKLKSICFTFLFALIIGFSIPIGVQADGNCPNNSCENNGTCSVPSATTFGNVCLNGDIPMAGDQAACNKTCSCTQGCGGLEVN